MPDIKLKDKSGAEKVYANIESVELTGSDGNPVEYFASGKEPSVSLENPADPSEVVAGKQFTVGNGEVLTGVLGEISSLGLNYRDDSTMVHIEASAGPGYIPDVLFEETTISYLDFGTFIDNIELNMAYGDQTISATDRPYSSVTIKKPDTLTSDNIMKGVNIGGVEGLLDPYDELEMSMAVSGAANGAGGFAVASPDWHHIDVYGVDYKNLMASLYTDGIIPDYVRPLNYLIAHKDAGNDSRGLYSALNTLCYVLFENAGLLDESIKPRDMFNSIFADADAVKFCGQYVSRIPKISEECLKDSSCSDAVNMFYKYIIANMFSEDEAAQVVDPASPHFISMYDHVEMYNGSLLEFDIGQKNKMWQADFPYVWQAVKYTSDEEIVTKYMLKESTLEMPTYEGGTKRYSGKNAGITIWNASEENGLTGGVWFTDLIDISTIFGSEDKFETRMSKRYKASIGLSTIPQTIPTNFFEKFGVVMDSDGDGFTIENNNELMLVMSMMMPIPKENPPAFPEDAEEAFIDTNLFDGNVFAAFKAGYAGVITHDCFAYSLSDADTSDGSDHKIKSKVILFYSWEDQIIPASFFTAMGMDNWPNDITLTKGYTTVKFYPTTDNAYTPNQVPSYADLIGELANLNIAIRYPFGNELPETYPDYVKNLFVNTIFSGANDFGSMTDTFALQQLLKWFAPDYFSVDGLPHDEFDDYANSFFEPVMERPCEELDRFTLTLHLTHQADTTSTTS